jgi:thioredoxin-like negative regulator of GroEL
MSTAAGILAVTDANLRDLVSSPRAVLVIGKSDCGHCIAYEREIVALQERGELGDVAIGKLLLDAPGSPRFKKENPWLASLQALPHTLLFVDGKHVENFAASRGAYLQERLEALVSAGAES